jgi:hypothetical protein
MSIKTSTNKLKVTELDFDYIKEALKEFLSGQDEFTDYNFESSGMAVLLDLLAYNTHYNAFYTNMLASEMFLDSAGIRSNVVSRAKQLGYTPHSKQGAEATVDFKLDGITSGAAEITVSKGFKIGSIINSKTYLFTTTEAATAKRSGASTTYYANSVPIREGVRLAFTQTATGAENELFTIPNLDVDTRSLEVSVNGEQYGLISDYTEATSTSKVYFLQEGDEEKYQIFFGDGVVGKSISVGDTISIQYITSRLGIEGNGAQVFAPGQSLAGKNPTIALTDSNSPASGGTSREAITSIKLKAPRGFETQKRTVTAQDYKTRLINDYPPIDTIKVWGGEDNTPPEYGKVYIAIKVKAGYTLSDFEKANIKDTLNKRNMVTVEPVFVDPEYLYLVLNADVTYDKRATTRTAAQLRSDVTATITGFALTDLNKFDNYFRHSNLLKKIDDTNVAIKNNAVGVQLRKEIVPTLNTSLYYTLNYDNELYHPHNTHMTILTSTLFNHSGYANCRLEDFNGVVRVVTSDGKTMVNRQAGTIDYDTGRVVLENFTPTGIADGTTKINVTVIPKNTNILSKENSIITILGEDLNITMVDDLEITKDATANY